MAASARFLWAFPAALAGTSFQDEAVLRPSQEGNDADKAFPLFSRRLLLAGTTAAAAVVAWPALAQDVIELGLVAPCRASRPSPASPSFAGLSVALDEINAFKGGLLGKKVELVVRDDESNPAKGVVAARELVQREKVAALFGGLDTPVSVMAIDTRSPTRARCRSWAYGRRARRSPATAAENHVFRVSAVDVLVDKAVLNTRSSMAPETRHDPDQQPVG